MRAPPAAPKRSPKPSPGPASHGEPPEAPARPGAPLPETPPSGASADFPVVGIGASAGWFEAFFELLQALPANPGMAIVLVTHLSPGHESQMPHVLSRMTPMPVREVRQDMPVERDHVYVIPAQSMLTLRGRTLHLEPREAGKGHMHVIDRFFRSLADEEGPRAIGVVLSGTLSDGTRGLRDIRAAGGFTFAQDPDSARYREMPWSAISAGCVDVALPPGAIALELLRVRERGDELRRAAEARPEEEGNLEGVLQLLRQRTGVDFSLYKRTTLRRRLLRRMMALRKESVEEYLAHLRRDFEEAGALHDELLIHVTRFFRDPATYDALRERVLPGLTSERPVGQPLRVWVPGCSTGEEAYSLAIAIHEYLNDVGLALPVQVFATDLSERAIQLAREGRYPESIAEDVSRDRLLRHFERTEDGYLVNKQVRGMCVFAVHNLAQDPPFSNMDIVSCRNVLVYMEPELQRRVLATIHYALRQAGYLVLGTAEAVGRSEELFQALDKEQRIYLKRSMYASPMHLLPIGRQPGPVAHRGVSGPEMNDLDVVREADRVVLERYAPAAVVVTRDLAIVQFRGRTGRFLQPPPGPPTNSLLKMAKDPLGLEVRNAVQKAAESRGVVSREGLRLDINGNPAAVDFEVVPLAGPGGLDRHFLVLFLEGGGSLGGDLPRGPVGRAPRGLLSRLLSGPRTAELQERLAESDRELSLAREALQSALEGHEAALEELRSANEEAVSSNEELQSTNEELETAKEELQSTNEELTTLNDELRQRNLEVQKVNNDLVNLLNSVGLPIVMLGADMRIRRFTPKAQEMLNLIPTDIGRPLTDIRLPFGAADLRSAVLSVLEDFRVQEIQVKDSEGEERLLRLHPYRTSDNRVDGVVLVVMRP